MKILAALVTLALWLASTPATATPPSDLEVLKGLFPKSSIGTLHGGEVANTNRGNTTALFPVYRGGLVGAIAREYVHSAKTGPYRLITFQLALTETDDFSAIANPPEREWPEHHRWLIVMGLIVVKDADGSFVAKPEGFPKEDWIEYPCMGDLCQFGKKGKIEALDAKRGVFLFRTVESDPSASYDSLRVIRVGSDGKIELGKEFSDGECSVCDECESSTHHKNVRIEGNFVMVDRIEGPTGSDCLEKPETTTVQMFKIQ